MKTFLLLIFLFFTNEINISISLKLLNTCVNPRSWKYLEKFAFVPSGRASVWKDAGVGHATWDIYHNYENTSFWMLAYSYPNVNDWNKIVQESVMSCSSRMSLAKYMQSINANSSILESTTFNGRPYKYHYSLNLEITNEILGTGSPQMVYWSFANCEQTCNAATGQYCEGVIDMHYAAHFYSAHTNSQLGELSFEYYGMVIFSILFLLLQFFCICPLAYHVLRLLRAKNKDHHTVRILFSVSVIYLLRLLFLDIFFASTINTGR